MSETLSTPECTTQVVAEKFRRRIIDGKWVEGEAVPAIRSLAKKYKTSNQTVQNAMHIIEGEGFIKRRVRRPAIVARQSIRNGNSFLASNSIKQIGLLKLPDANRHERVLSGASTAGDDWSLRILESLKQRLLDQGYEVVYLPSLGEDEDCLEALANRGLGGYVFMGRSRLKELHHSLGKAGVPWVCFCGVGYEDEHNVVHAKNMAGGRKVGDAFVRLGYKKVLCLASDFGKSVTCTQKATGLSYEYIKSGLGVSGLTVVSCGSMDQSAGYKATKEYIREFGVPDGIFATGDILALGACDACAEAGVVVGKEVGIVGATGLDGSSYFRPPLTVLRQPMEEMGFGAADMLIEMIEEEKTIVPSRGFESDLIARESCKIPNDASTNVEDSILE